MMSSSLNVATALASGPSPSSSAGAEAVFACDRPRGWAAAGGEGRVPNTVATAAASEVKRFMGAGKSSRHAIRNLAVYLGIQPACPAGLDYLGLRTEPPPPITRRPRAC